MRWPRRSEDPPSRADEAIETSREQLDEAVAQRRRWDDLAHRLRAMREANHLAERFRDALEGR